MATKAQIKDFEREFSVLVVASLLRDKDLKPEYEASDVAVRVLADQANTSPKGTAGIYYLEADDKELSKFRQSWDRWAKMKKSKSTV